MAKIRNKVEDYVTVLLLVALVGGSIAIPLFLNTSGVNGAFYCDTDNNVSTPMVQCPGTTSSALAYAALFTIVLAAIAITIIRHARIRKR